MHDYSISKGHWSTLGVWGGGSPNVPTTGLIGTWVLNRGETRGV